MTIQQVKKALRFIISGGLAAFTALVLFYFFNNILNIYYIYASIISFVLSVFVGFYLQKYFTFENKDEKATKKQMVLFALFSLLNLMINVALMAIFVGGLAINPILSKILTLGIIAFWNFFAYQRFVFKK